MGQKRVKKEEKRAARKQRTKAKEATRQGGRSAVAVQRRMSGLDFYVGLQQIVGTHLNVSEMLDNISQSNWAEAFVHVAHLAAMSANLPGGVRNARVRNASLLPLLQVEASGPIVRVQEFVRANFNRMNIAHEEALNYVQHLIVLHGGVMERKPSDYERSMWLLSAGDHVAKWAELDDRPLTANEVLIAEAAKASRANRASDPLRDLARIYLMFRSPPEVGSFHDPVLWKELQETALGSSYDTYFRTCIFPLFIASKGCGTGTTKVSEFPVIQVSSWCSIFGEDAERVAHWLQSLSVDRAVLQGAIRQRMDTKDRLPHSPTGLIHHPLVKLRDDFIGVASPWALRAHLLTGIWAAFFHAAKTLGKTKEWTPNFGYLFEGWLRRVVRMVPASSSTRFLLADRIGGEDEVEDIVALEPGHAILFSAKSRMVKEEVARGAVSRSRVLDWYEDFFFARKSKGQRGGAVRLLDARISMLREGIFERYGVERNCHVIPVLVTFDDLCEERELYQWVESRCRAHGLLQKENISPLVLANVDEFERLMAIPRRGESLATFLRARDTVSRHVRLDMQLHSTRKQDRFPEMETAFDEVCALLRHRGDMLIQS
jgi:hypothetical protein